MTEGLLAKCEYYPNIFFYQLPKATEQLYSGETWQTSLNQVINVNITHWAYQHQVSHTLRRTQYYFCGLLDKYTHPHSNCERTSDIPKLKEFIQNNWLVFAKSVKVIQNNERVKKCHICRRLRGHNNCMQRGILH